LKTKCLASHQEWLNAGKPRSGAIFENRNLDKKKYRERILLNKNKSKTEISDSMLHCLYSGNSVNFWKNWNKKLNEKQTSLPIIVGCNSPTSAVHAFKEFFDKINNTIDENFNNSMSNKFNELYKVHEKSKLYAFNVDNMDESKYSAMLIDIAVGNLNNNKAPGIDNLQKEHLTHSHPVLYCILSKLFYLMMLASYVPNEFGKGIIIPIQKDATLKGAQNVDNFRGITLCPIISKVFEQCLLFLYNKYLTSNDRQFGFKKSLGCAHAIFSVRNVIEYYVSNDSTVNICCLDISKAFDKLNHNCLFYKLLSIGVPVHFINILRNWYSKLISHVRWGNTLSKDFKISCGIRQGGILSPTLFNLYVDSILNKLDNMGCKFKGVHFGSFMYADDLILLSPSVVELQNMLSICCKELELISLTLNVKKSVALRIGKRCYEKCFDLSTSWGGIQWVSETKYLGLYLKSGKLFKINLDPLKSKFYSSFNAMYCKLGHLIDPNISVHLLQSIALPVLIYAFEVINLNKSELDSLNHSFRKALFKIFGSFDNVVITNCMEVYGLINIPDLHKIRTENFVSKLIGINNVYLSILSKGY